MHLKNRVIIMAMTCTWLLTCLPTVRAADLIETYHLAIKHDQAWQSDRSRYIANKEYELIGRAGLLPQINFTASHSNITYDTNNSGDASEVGLLLNLGVDQFLNCLFATAVNTIFPPAGGAPPDIIDICSPEATAPSNNKFTVDKFGLSLSQPLYRLDRWYSFKRSVAQSDQAYAEYLRDEQALMLRVANLYFTVLKSWEQVEFAKSEESSIKKQLRLTQNRYQKGLASSSDVFEAQAVADLKHSTRLSAELAFDAAIEDLERITNQPGIEIAPLPDDLIIESPSPGEIDPWIASAKRNNIEIIVARFANRVSQQNHKLRRAAHAPTLDLTAAYQRQNSNGSTAAFDSGHTDTTTIGFTFNVPLYTGGALSARERQAKYQMRQSEYQLEEVTREVTSTVRKLYRNLEANIRVINALKIAIDSNTKAVRRVEKGYQKGARHISDLLQAQRDLYKTKLDLANARYDYVMDSLNLKRAAGVLNKSDLASFNAWLDHNFQPGTAAIEARLPRLNERDIDASKITIREPRDAYNPDSTPSMDRIMPSAAPQQQQPRFISDEKKPPGKLKTLFKKLF